MKEDHDQSGHDDVTILAGRKSVEPPKQENTVEPEPKAEQPEKGADGEGHDDVTVLASSFAEKLRQAESAQEKAEQPAEMVESAISGEGESLPEESAQAVEPSAGPSSPASEVFEPSAGEIPPPPVPPGDTAAGKPGKNNKTILIIVIVAVVLLLCCCVALIIILGVSGIVKEYSGSIMKMMAMASLLQG